MLKTPTKELYIQLQRARKNNFAVMNCGLLSSILLYTGFSCGLPRMMMMLTIATSGGRTQNQ